MFDLPRANTHKERNNILWRLHIDLPLLFGLIVLLSIGLAVLFSAVGGETDQVVKQAIRIALALLAMFVVAQVPPRVMQLWAIWLFLFGLILLVLVIVMGDVGKGAQRWLKFGGFRFQPSELMKLAVPLAAAWYFSDKALPPRILPLILGFILIITPTLLIAAQPDLGTSLLICSSGIFVIFLAGISWRIIGFLAGSLAAFLPILWFFLMHEYQKQRVRTLFNPEADPLGSGYHIIQSKIAIGSGGLMGKGWLNGTQSRLDFLPERTTDFIFSVFCEEFGLIGVLVLLTIYIFVIARGLYIATQAQDTFTRLLAGSITLTFFVYLFVNIGMVIGILPVVGLPLPLISWGGTSLITMLVSFGILMSIHTHRQLLSK
jgi:rod shape determining protein RodA